MKGAKYMSITDIKKATPGEKKHYAPPTLVHYGSLRDLTQSGSGKSSESKGKGDTDGGICEPNQFKKPCGSDLRIKENINRIGEHPLGIGLYLFDYKAEFRDLWGHDRQFGVMAQDVETVMPEAVATHSDGYKMVDYALLGIKRSRH
jgi:hypothetical protein